MLKKTGGPKAAHFANYKRLTELSDSLHPNLR